MTREIKNVAAADQRDEIQTSVDSEAGTEQVSQGDLMDDSGQPGDDTQLFQRSAVIDLELPIGEIRRIEEIHDYRLPSMSPIPIVLKTPDAIHCLDGWRMVEVARERGEESIQCRVNFIAECSADDLAFQKVAVRTRTQGGIATYSEMVANTAKLQELLLLSAPGLVTNSHGGSRDQGDEQDSLPGEIARRLGKERKTILQYLSHSKYLNEQTLHQLVEIDAPKKFFENIHGAKRQIIAALQEQFTPEAEITARVSEAVAEMLTAYTSDRPNFTNAMSEILLRYTGNDTTPADTAVTNDNPADPGEPANPEPGAREEQPLPEDVAELRPIVVRQMRNLVQTVETAPNTAAFWMAVAALHEFATRLYANAPAEPFDNAA
jgi:hypothetical protein